ncbi:electron transfer flavoprotein subunit beta/FixA family protein [Devosia sp. ZB163]|uniref:electron transfer flavoprotein subunit beta/FixA family protein n=1 Tax=Devosia sp. ZB163 TaxID=3025938 RepID=UPI00235FB674|nr:electron transfer flavoprotein subunit beta/FixA family protein [Devosia sp. ZB163]MDC9825153.1 electron transfer flavoprotein subunit beta/FixA family protein [Devosia sp. ZB163]
MKALVGVKWVLDFSVKVRLKSDGTGADLAGARMSMNPFDEIALEQAIRLKEAGAVDEIVVVSVGPRPAADILRRALAMGADRAVLVRSDAPVEPLGVAKALKSLVERDGAGLVLLGKQAIDDDNNQTGQMLAALLGWPQATYAAELAVEGNVATVTCESDDGLETVRLTLPAVVTADLRLNTPRHISLPNIMKAKNKPLEEIAPEALNVDLRPRLKVLRTDEPAKRRAGVMVASVDELLDKLRGEAKVI